MIDDLPINERVRLGKNRETQIAAALRKKGYDIQLVTDPEIDKKQKIDAVLTLNGQKGLVQIKTRDNDSGRDILLCVYQPFIKKDDPANVGGRDYISPYQWCISHIQNTTRIIRGSTQKHLLDNVLKEWNWSPKLPFDSKVYPGVQLRTHRDRNSGIVKLLCFIPPAIYDKYDVVAVEKIILQ